jgi:hypothetical protein
VQNARRATARERRATMSIGDQASDSPARSQSQSPAKDDATNIETSGGGHRQRFTGVVLIHGLGLIPRNSMLQQVLNALSYWFNREAGLALATKGPGRIWLSPHLTDDPDPDQPESRATMDIVAPGPKNASAGRDSAVRLKFREVWWAESFGMPDIGQTISWAQVQWREQAARLLIPIRWRRGSIPSATAAPGAVSANGSGRPAGLPVRRETQPLAAGDTGAAVDRAPLRRGTRGTLAGLLLLYGLYQYLWKVIQWLILTPAITLLLIIMGIVRVLAIVPFLQSAVVTTFTATINTVMLHWVAEIQVYLTDYTRSSAIRERFIREVKAFLSNPLCDRVMVIAESGGTYIAYEGLTTLLGQPDLPLNEQGDPKPVTFVSIATALRRIWLLSNTDRHRLHGVLPTYVRWLHFWARYDPVAAGPLDESSLPRIPKWDPPEENPEQQIRDSLKQCINFGVANTDSTFTDHVHYWDNLEQVVGQVACELVAGHPLLEEAVRAKLASPDKVLLRRWGVAWRYTLALTGGLAAGLGVLLWAASHPEFGNGITMVLQQVDWGSIVDSVCAPCKAFIGNPVPQLSQNPTAQQLGQYSRAQAITYLFTHFLTAPTLLVVALALIVMASVGALITQLVVKPTPFAFPESVAIRGQRLGTIYAICAVGVALIFLASLIFTSYVHHAVSLAAVPSGQLVSGYIWALGLGEFAYSAAIIASLVDVVQRRSWGWGLGGFCALVPLTTFDPFYRSALLAVAVVVCVVLLFRPVRPSGVGKVTLVLVALMSIIAGIGTTLFDFNVLRTPLLGAGVYVEYLLGPLLYGLWLGRAKPEGNKSDVSALRRANLVLVVAYFGVLSLLSIPFIVGNRLYAHVYNIAPLFDIVGASSASSPDVLRAIGVLLTLIIGVAMLVLCVVDARNAKRWGWLVALPLLFVGLTAWFEVFSRLGVKSTLPEGGLLLSFALAAPALIYVLWAAPERWHARRKLASRELRSVQS